MKKDGFIGFKLPSKSREFLARAAKAERTTISAICRRALLAHIETEQAKVAAVLATFPEATGLGYCNFHGDVGEETH
jgi:predicted transcriptional regulator